MDGFDRTPPPFSFFLFPSFHGHLSLSDRLYQGLTDSDPYVKKNTLMVLTHLILNGMIKVKGQLGEMAKCIEDPSPRIGDLARLFFKELSTKENALYNNLQDVISHLSAGKFAVDEETFEKTMRYIFTFIEKVRMGRRLSLSYSCWMSLRLSSLDLGYLPNLCMISHELTLMMPFLYSLSCICTLS